MTQQQNEKPTRDECTAAEYESGWMVEYWKGPNDWDLIAGPFETEKLAQAWIDNLPPINAKVAGHV